jgi:hypothetical protein
MTMFPWLWFWAPQVHFPWSGAVTQRIDPDTHWFFQGIAPSAGNARIEERAFEVASYGKQLGLITEVLLDVARQSRVKSPQAAQSLAKLEAISQQIAGIKHDEYTRAAADIATQVEALRRQGGAPYEQLLARLAPLLKPA